MIVTKTGFPITYSVTNPGVHDMKVFQTLSAEVRFPNILGDKGYISHEIHEKLTLKGIENSVSPSRIMDKSRKIDHRLLTRKEKRQKPFSLFW